MSVESILFNLDKYQRLTRGGQVLIGIGPKTSIFCHSDTDGSERNIEKHHPCMAWAVLHKSPDDTQYYNNDTYYIKSFIGDPKYGIQDDPDYYNQDLPAELSNYTYLSVEVKEAIVISGGVKPLYRLCSRLHCLFRKAVIL